MTVAELRNLFDEARPLVKQWLGLSEQFSAFREAATEKGFDWSQIKALLKAQAMDERDGTDKHVKRIIERAEFASSYAAMLGLGTVNEIIFSDELQIPAAPVEAAATESNPEHGKAPRGYTLSEAHGTQGQRNEGGGHVAKNDDIHFGKGATGEGLNIAVPADPVATRLPDTGPPYDDLALPANLVRH